MLAVRKKQCRELATVVGRSLERERDEASAREGLGKQIARQSMEARAIEARDGAWFNENSNFVACVHTLVPSPLQATAAPSSAAVASCPALCEGQIRIYRAGAPSSNRINRDPPSSLNRRHRARLKIDLV